MSSETAAEPASSSSIARCWRSTDGAQVYREHPRLWLAGLVCARHTSTGEILHIDRPDLQRLGEGRRKRLDLLEAQCLLFGSLQARAQAEEADIGRILNLPQETDRQNTEARERLRLRRSLSLEPSSSSKRWASGTFRQ